MGRKLGLICSSCWPGKYTSGSGSVIGRDPLPPRAVSTSQPTLQRTPAQPSQPVQVSTLPRTSANSVGIGIGNHEKILPINHSTPQYQQPLQQQQQSISTSPIAHEGMITSQILLRTTISNGDIRSNSSDTVNNNSVELLVPPRDQMLMSPGRGHSAQQQQHQLVSAVGHSRVVSPIDNRVSSPSDSERLVRSPRDKRMVSNSLGNDLDQVGRTGTLTALADPRNNIGLRQDLRSVRDYELLNKRSNVSSPRVGVAGSSISSASTNSSGNIGISNIHNNYYYYNNNNRVPGQQSYTVPNQGLVRVSAGDLLGRTHEELVLLLIQLRRQSATICKAMETCHMEIEAQAQLAELDTPKRLENFQKLDDLEKHLMDLEKQYEKGKPLVNLVDNMVKLGSLYNRNTANGTNDRNNVSSSAHDLLQENMRNHYQDRLEFNQRVQEQRLLAEERKDWDRLSPDHGKLQAKVQQLFKLDRLLQEESGTLHSLQQDKEILEKALGGLRHKLQGSKSSPAEAERYRKQRLVLERELSRVRLLLAHNSKKLEETVAENARLEQDLVVLRQKLKASRRYAGSMTRDSTGTTAALEAELRRVQQLVGDLQRQRQELSIQVRQLTEKSHNLVQQIRPQPMTNPPPAVQHHHPKKRTHNSWLETDLDSGITFDYGSDPPSSSPPLSTSPRGRPNGMQSHRPNMSPMQCKEEASKENSHRYSPPPLLARQSQQSQQQQPLYIQNQMSSLSPQLREQIQQHQLKQQLLRDQMQGKRSPVQVNTSPLYVNTRRHQETTRHNENGFINGPTIMPPEYIPPPPPPPPLIDEEILMNGTYNGQNEDNKFSGLMHNREKQEIKTVRIVKRESERRQRDRGDRTSGNIGIPLTNGLQIPNGIKRIGDDEFGGSQHFEKTQLSRVIEESSPMSHAQSTVHLTEASEDDQFVRSMSLPRGFGGQRHQHQPHVHQPILQAPPRSDSMYALKNLMTKRHRVRFENHDGSSDSTLSPYTDSPTTSSSHLQLSSTSLSYSPVHQIFVNEQLNPLINRLQVNNQTIQPSYAHGKSLENHLSSIKDQTNTYNNSELTLHEQGNNNPDKPFGSVASVNSLPESPSQLSPIFKSEAAKQIIKEMTEKKTDEPKKRQVPREKRRHYTVSSSNPLLDHEDAFTKMGMGRARDDLDMERALRPRINAPDVVRSTLSQKELKYNESTIDQLLGTPNKILIPERYIPEQAPELTAEEKEQRLKKAESIRKMLSETTVTTPEGNDDDAHTEKSDTLKKKVAEERKQREHILQLNQILAKQVMEKSKMVAVQALATLPLNQEPSFEEDDLSPVASLPIQQQRENFYS